jgi:pilus assembly protein CpaB
VKRRLIAIVLAGFLALVAGAATVLYVAGSNARAVAGQRAVKVWVTTDAIPRGTTLGTAKAKGLLKQESLPARSTPTVALTELGKDTLIAMSDIAAGEVLLKGRFGEKDSLGPRALTVPTGHVAVSVEVDDPQRVANFVKPGDFVALFHFDGEQAGVVFSRVQVLGVGAASEKKKAASDQSSKDTGAALTLSLTHAEAAQLVAKFSVVLNDKKQYLHFALLPANEEVAPQTVAKVEAG